MTVAKFHNLKKTPLSVFPKQIFSFTLNVGFKCQKVTQPLKCNVGLSRVGCVRFSRVNLINVLFYLTFGAGVTLDVISQHISVLGQRFCGDRRLKSRVCFLSLHFWNFNESKKTSTQATPLLETPWVSDYVTPSKPARRLPLKHSNPGL